MKSNQKDKAISLRKSGKTYSDILKEVPVAKSTLSLWLREIGLSKKQKQAITEKRLQAALRGGESKRQQRIERVRLIEAKAIGEIKNINKREFLLMGAMLYWAEGEKERDRPGTSVGFGNSDPRMIRFFLKWLFEACDVDKKDVEFGLYIHENSRSRIDFVKKTWSKYIGYPKEKISYVYFKKHNIKTKRKNIGDGYIGILRVRVKASSTLNRKIFGWIKGINKFYWGMV